MTKYNKSEIFKRMWQLVKETSLNRSQALKRAWVEAKTPAKEGTEKQIAYAKSLYNKMIETCDEFYNKYAKGEDGDFKQIRLEAVAQTRAEFEKKYNETKSASNIINYFLRNKVDNRFWEIVRAKRAERKAQVA